MQEHFQAQAGGEWLPCHPHHPVTAVQHLGRAVLLTPSQQKAVCEPGITSSHLVCLLCRWCDQLDSGVVRAHMAACTHNEKKDVFFSMQLSPHSCKLRVMLYHCRV